ncbi:MAG: VCBS repeat-containing protein [Bryobacterales bacterium]|nr:VCBS repeat-containing protein [Bryobacterales bacterium]
MKSNATLQLLGGLGLLMTPLMAQPLSFTRTDYATRLSPIGVATADFDKDGKVDIVVMESAVQGFSLFRGLGNGQFAPPVSFNLNPGAAGGLVYSTDFNSDSNPDIIIPRPSSTGQGFGNQVTAVLGSGTGSFNLPGFTFTSGGTNIGLEVGDIDGDAKPDVVVGSCDSGMIHLYHGNGDGTFSGLGTLPFQQCGGPANFPIRLADLNADGKLDLMAANPGDNTFVSVFLGLGGGAFGPRVRYGGLGSQANHLAAIDANEDGRIDLAVTNQVSSTISVLLGNGVGGFLAPLTFPSIQSPYWSVAGDFNLDGHIDLATTSYPTGLVSVVFGNGTGQFGSSQTFPVGSGSAILAASDFNGDGRPDIVVGNNASASISVLLNSTGPTDQTPPSVVPQVTGSFGNNGWYVSNVSVAWTVTDPESTVTSATGCDAATVTSDTAGVVFTCTATSSGGTATQSVTVKRDGTPPAILASRSPAPNANGWNNSAVTVSFACSDTLSGPTSPGSAFVLSSDGAGQSVPGTCADLAGNAAAATVSSINIDTRVPTISDLAVTPNPQAIGSPVTIAAQLADTGPSGLSYWQYTLDGGAPANTAISGFSRGVSTPVSLPSAGVYEVCLVAADLAGNLSQPSCTLAVIYDPSGGFVTGGGWFQSPVGAYSADPALTGKATFGFVSRYQKGATTPSGNTQFQFQAAGLSFKSTAYEWLVVAGARAQYKGTGKVNGIDGHSFMVTAIDGDLPGGGGADRIRIKITGPSGVVYDNKPNANDSSDPDTSVMGGSIVIHR